MENFLRSIEELIEEREMAMLEIEKVLYISSKLSQTQYEVLTIQSISIIYSFWEGFVQRSFKEYIEYLNHLDIGLAQFTDEIRLFHIENTFKQLSNYPKESKKRVAFISDLEQYFSLENHRINSAINTESNVSFEVLNKLLVQFSLTKFPEHWGNYKYPNTNLKCIMKDFLRYRNSVAHGGDISSEEKVNQEVYNKYRSLVKDLMWGLYEKFEMAIGQNAYLKQVE